MYKTPDSLIVSDRARKDAKDNIPKLQTVYNNLKKSGHKINKTVLAKNAGVSTKTVQRYYDQIAV